jgi:hypothetical protein
MDFDEELGEKQVKTCAGEATQPVRVRRITMA